MNEQPKGFERNEDAEIVLSNVEKLSRPIRITIAGDTMRAYVIFDRITGRIEEITDTVEGDIDANQAAVFITYKLYRPIAEKMNEPLLASCSRVDAHFTHGKGGPHDEMLAQAMNEHLIDDVARERFNRSLKEVNNRIRQYH